MNISEVKSWNQSYERKLAEDCNRQNKEMMRDREYISKVKIYLDNFFKINERDKVCILPEELRTYYMNRKGYNNSWNFKDYVEFFYSSQYNRFIRENIHKIDLILE